MNELPPVTPYSVYLRVMAEAFIRTAHVKRKRRAAAWIDEIDRLLTCDNALANVLPIRPPSDAADVMRARRQAQELWRRQHPNFRLTLAKVRRR